MKQLDFAVVTARQGADRCDACGQEQEHLALVSAGAGSDKVTRLCILCLYHICHSWPEKLN